MLGKDLDKDNECAPSISLTALGQVNFLPQDRLNEAVSERLRWSQ